MVTNNAIPAIGWQLDYWEEGSGIRISKSAEDGSLEFGLLFTRERAEDSGLLRHVSHGDSSAHVNVKKLDPECEVYQFGGLGEAVALRQWLRMVLSAIESGENE